MLDFILVRLIFVLIFGFAAVFFRPAAEPWWTAALVGSAIAVAAILLERRIAKVSLKRLIGIAAGAVAGLVCAALVSIVLGRLGAETSPTLHFAQVVCLLLFVYVGVVTGAAKGELLNLGAFGGVFGTETDVRHNHKILDGVLVIPQFVLHELQMVADSADSMKRNRGRRGLDVLQRIQKMGNLKVQIVLEDFPQVREVDMKLIELAKVYSCKIITNDFNLNKVAHLRGVEVLNINELANSLKPIVLPGELMRVFILKEGKEYNQGVAYLDDGTMVVVDNARRMISKTIDISVTSVLQTTAGKMIFGKYDERAHAASVPGASSVQGTAATQPRRETAVGEG